jgi:uncharacterized protein (DUF2236 family)
VVAANESPNTAPVVDKIMTRERFYGTEKRWRRFGEPTPAGGSLKEDGTPDYGLFGPGSIAWEIILHPSMMLLETIGQQMLQTTYKPIFAGVRDVDPLSRKAVKGTLTGFDGFDRAQRNSGIHAPMWLGDTASATRLAQHIHKIHEKVVKDVIDVGAPELGGYSANSPRDALWAALTEMHAMLWLYEAFAFRDGKFPHPLTPEQRDQYFAESAPYLRLVGADESEIPKTVAEVAALYKKYANLFGHTDTLGIMPDTGEDFHTLMSKVMRKNFHISQWRVVLQLMLQFFFFTIPVAGAMSAPTRRSMRFSPLRDKVSLASKKLFLPIIWFIQQPRIESYYMRLLWGPDAVVLIRSARKLHQEALAKRAAQIAV